MPFFPGPGLGGHCIPIDPFYLTWKAKEVGCPTRFIELAGEINTDMPRWVVDQVALALNSRAKALRGSKILVLGLAYKPNVDDSRESPAFELIERLLVLGAEVDYSDPHIPVAPKVRRYDLKMSSVDVSETALKKYDCVLIATHHDLFDWSLIADHASLVVDTRDAMRRFELTMGDRLVRA
jgi:UDP-N-acetyl-D-glucosamine dehydrogenase